MGKALAVVTDAAAEKNPEAAVIDRIASETIKVPIVGTAPLIVHRFSEKAKQMMLDNMTGKKSPKKSKDPKAEYEAAAYRFEDGRYGFPAIAFKLATVSAARFYPRNSVTMTALKQFLFVHGEIGDQGDMLVPILGDGPRMRESVVRVARGGADLRYRPEFVNWSVELIVTYVSSALTRGSILSLIDAAGMGVGIGEWRPEKRGMNGTFRIDDSTDIEVITS
mgnify:CR=1 FL=1|jgi:hypothetical protein|tara:strand:- start:5385 stop:6050 length:666 start_codon:yes stop_codon:yes gene_type:complete